MRILYLFLLVCLCVMPCGCAVHQFQKSEKLGGYGVARFGYVIPEYTVNLENKAPGDIGLAAQRYKRRKDTVEKLYIKMGQIEDYLTRYITHFPKIMWSIFANTMKMPFHIVSEYRYEHNEQYRKRIDELDAREEAKEDARIKQLKDALSKFIRQDLEKESSLLNGLAAPLDKRGTMPTTGTEQSQSANASPQ